MSLEAISGKTIIRTEEYGGSAIKVISRGTFRYIDISTKSLANAEAWVVRTDTDPIYVSTTALPTPVPSARLAYTVADGSLFREGEFIKVLGSDDAYKGTIAILEIDGNNLHCNFKFKQTSFTPAVGDKLTIKQDSILDEAESLSIIPVGFPYLILHGTGTVDIQPLVTGGLVGKE